MLDEGLVFGGGVCGVGGWRGAEEDGYGGGVVGVGGEGLEDSEAQLTGAEDEDGDWGGGGRSGHGGWEGRERMG